MKRAIVLLFFVFDKTEKLVLLFFLFFLACVCFFLSGGAGVVQHDPHDQHPDLRGPAPPGTRLR